MALIPGSGGGGGIADIVEDLTPQLGGDLDLNGDQITSPDGTDLTDIPNGSIDLQTNSTSRLDITDSGVRLGATGARVTSITDSDALGTSDTVLCTQGNVKAYVDADMARFGYLIPGNTQYICSGGISINFGTSNLILAADTIYYMELDVWHATNTWDLIGCQIGTGSAGQTVRLALYNNGADNKPTTLIIDAGTLAVDTGGVKTATLNQSLAPGIYWAAISCSVGSTVTSSRTNSTMINPNRGVSNFAAAGGTGYTESFTYGAYPATAGSLTLYNAATTPIVFIKES